MYHLSPFFFFALLNITVCESLSLFSSSNSSLVLSPLQATSLTYTPRLTGVTDGQYLPSSHEQFLQKFSLETTIISVNDGFISKFGVYTGKAEKSVSNTDLLVSSSLKVEAQIAHTTPRNRHSVGKTLQSETRETESTKRSGLTRAIPNTMIQTSSVQLSTRIAQEFLNTFSQSGTMSTREISQNFRFSAGSLVQPNMAMSTTNSFIALSPSFMVSNRYASVTRKRDFSVFSSREKFTGSALHMSNYLLTTRNLTRGAERGKSSLLSHYSSGVAVQAREVSTSQRATQVSSLVTRSSAINQVTSSSFTSLTTTRISPSFTSSTISQTSTLTSFSSSVGVKSSPKSAWSKVHLHLTKAITASSLVHTTSVQPLLSSVVTTQEETSLSCRVNNTMCICFNCDEAPKNTKICCMGLVDNENIRQGVTMTVKNITVHEFHLIVMAVSRAIADIVWNSCHTNVSLCLTGENSPAASVRKKRSLLEQNIQSKPTSDRIRTKREALQPDINPTISRVDTIIYNISFQAGSSPGVQTAFYVTVTSFRNGTNQTILLDGKKLLKILRNEIRTLESSLNITIESFTAAHQSSKLATTSSHPVTLAPNSSHGSQNMQTTLSTGEAPTTAVLGRLENEDSKGLSQELLILIICAGIGGLILISIVMACIFTRFYRQRKGEFVPDKNYLNNHKKQNGEAGGEDVENIDTFIDPSTQITDVPHKPTRGSAGGAAGGPKKQRKPMGVKVTYKPPEWD